MYSTPKRKRSPKKNQVETPKFPRLTLENQKKPNHVPNPRNKPLKPNPHPHCNQKQFVKIDTKLQLIKHQGLAITTKKKRPKIETNRLETKPVTPKKPIVETKPSTPRRFPSKDFTQLAKMFQLHTPPSRLISKQKPKPGNQENLNPIHCNKNQIEPEKTVQVLKRQNLTSQTQPSCQGPSVKTRKNSEKCQKSTNPPPPTVNFRQNPVQKSSHRRKSSHPSPHQDPPPSPRFRTQPCQNQNYPAYFQYFQNLWRETNQPIRIKIEITRAKRRSDWTTPGKHSSP
jgi:hypothetical protein